MIPEKNKPRYSQVIKTKIMDYFSSYKTDCLENKPYTFCDNDKN